MRDLYLSPRLRCIYESIRKEAESIGGTISICDVGCDHAHVPIRLLLDGVIDFAYCLDVIPGPLDRAEENVDQYGLTNKVKIILSDGLACFEDTADMLCITGMGGSIMSRIITEDSAKTRSFKAMVLSPQSDHEKVRTGIRELGFRITDEKMITEKGKFYPVILCGNAGNSSPETRSFTAFPDIPDRISDLFGPVLISRKDPVLYRYLERGKAKYSAVLENMPDSERRMEIEQLLNDMEFVLKLYD